MPGANNTKDLPVTEQMGVILERIDSLRADINEVKADLKKLHDAYGMSETTYARNSVRYDTVTVSAHQRIDNHELRLLAIEKVVPQLLMIGRVATIIGGMLLASILALLWSIFTHQVTIIFP